MVAVAPWAIVIDESITVGASFTLITSIVTIAGSRDDHSPSDTLKVNWSEPE